MRMEALTGRVMRGAVRVGDQWRRSVCFLVKSNRGKWVGIEVLAIRIEYWLYDRKFIVPKSMNRAIPRLYRSCMQKTGPVSGEFKSVTAVVDGLWDWFVRWWWRHVRTLTLDRALCWAEQTVHTATMGRLDANIITKQVSADQLHTYILMCTSLYKHCILNLNTIIS